MLELYHYHQEMRKKMMEYFGASPELQATASYFCYQIFVLKQKIPTELEFDKLDTTDPKFLVFFDEQHPVATTRYQKIDKTYIKS